MVMGQLPRWSSGVIVFQFVGLLDPDGNTLEINRAGSALPAAHTPAQ
jgi:hypothetical protein